MARVDHRPHVITILLFVACGNPSEADPGAFSSESSGGADDDGSQVSTSTSSSTGASTTADLESSGGTSGETTSGTDDDGDDASELVGCPDTLPGAWVLCEDFDGITDPWGELGAFISIDAALAVESGPARSGRQALRIRQVPEVDWGGWAVLRFGRGPAGPVVHAPDEDFDEVWVRFWTRTGADWPDGGIGDLVEVQALSLESSAIAADATVLGPTGSKAPRLIGWSCVHDGVLACDGINDWGNPNLVARGHTMGTAPLFGQDYAEEWHCVVLHVRLDRPGMHDGSIALTIDGELDAQLDDLELVGTWPGTRLNAVKFSSWWPSVPHPLERHIDDVVVATVPLGCPPWPG